MGGSSSSTTTTETGALSATGKQYDSMLQGMIFAQLEESGYEYAGNEVTEYEDPDEAAKVKANLNVAQTQVDSIQADINANPWKGSGNDPRNQSLWKAKQDVAHEQSELANQKQTTYTKYDIKKKPDPRVQDAINKYGADAPEVAAIKESIFQEGVTKANTMAGVEADYLKNLKKFVSGDYSYTPEQEAQIDKFIAPFKDTIISTVDTLQKKYGENEAKLKEGWNDVMTEVNKTGFEIMDALDAAVIQIDKGKGDLLGVLKKVNESTEAKFKFQQDLLFEKIDKQAAQQAAFLGLPPGSMAENMQKAKAKQDVFTQLQLELHEQELKGQMGIEEQAVTDKKQISLSKVALAASQGGKKEEIAKGILGITGEYAGKEEQLLGAKGNALLALEQEKQKKMQDVAMGNIPSILAAATGAKGFEQAFKIGEQNYNIGGMAPTAGQLATEQQRTFAETTSETTQSKSPGFLDVFSGIVGTGAAAAGAGFKGYEALSGGGSKKESGGLIQV